MENKKAYKKPKFKVSEFSVRDIIRASVVPCPGQDDPCDESDLASESFSLDDQILNGTIK